MFDFFVSEVFATSVETIEPLRDRLFCVELDVKLSQSGAREDIRG